MWPKSFVFIFSFIAIRFLFLCILQRSFVCPTSFGHSAPLFLIAFRHSLRSPAFTSVYTIHKLISLIGVKLFVLSFSKKACLAIVTLLLILYYTGRRLSRLTTSSISLNLLLYWKPLGGLFY